MTTTPIKFEQSPADSLADSFASTPGTLYPSLFDSQDAMDGSEVMTPPFDEDEDNSMFGSIAGTPAPESKPVKKRKSWGQQLPEPKTNLPPRKRAKTEDEKEQRRVERVLRNRRAAQSSRERKRAEVQQLEQEKMNVERRASDLEMRLAHMEQQNMILQQQIAEMTSKMTVFNGSSPAAKTEQFSQAPTPITLSQDLFPSRDSQTSATFERPMSTSARSHSLQTVNPASLSPEMKPVADSSFNASSSDMTQHPAAMLCDLPCQSEKQRPWMDTSNLSLSVMLILVTMITTTSSAFLQPLSQILNSLRTGSSLQPTSSILTMIIWLATTTASLSNSTSTTTSTTTTTTHSSHTPRFSLRMNLLRRLLSCSPQLARPLKDATMGVMRSASEQQLSFARECLGGNVSVCDRVSATEVGQPSMACLMTLLWAIDVIDREQRRADNNNHERSQELENVAGMDAEQANGLEPDGLFRLRNVNGLSFSVGRGIGGDVAHEKSFGNRRSWELNQHQGDA